MNRQERDKQAIAEAIDKLHLMRQIAESGAVVRVEQSLSKVTDTEPSELVTVSVSITYQSVT